MVDFRWHDLRHEATSRLFEKGLNLMEVASITGHQDLKMLKRYTHLRAEDLVGRLGQSSTSTRLQSTGRLNALRCGRFVEVVNATVCECVEDVPSDDPPAV